MNTLYNSLSGKDYEIPCTWTRSPFKGVEGLSRIDLIVKTSTLLTQLKGQHLEKSILLFSNAWTEAKTLFCEAINFPAICYNVLGAKPKVVLEFIALLVSTLIKKLSKLEILKRYNFSRIMGFALKGAWLDSPSAPQSEDQQVQTSVECDMRPRKGNMSYRLV